MKYWERLFIGETTSFPERKPGASGQGDLAAGGRGAYFVRGVSNYLAMAYY